jgi:hypothetical protein
MHSGEDETVGSNVASDDVTTVETSDVDSKVNIHAANGSQLQKLIAETKWIILVFVVWCVITLPCACFLGYRTQWILWKLGLR